MFSAHASFAYPVLCVDLRTRSSGGLQHQLPQLKRHEREVRLSSASFSCVRRAGICRNRCNSGCPSWITYPLLSMCAAPGPVVASALVVRGYVEPRGRWASMAFFIFGVSCRGRAALVTTGAYGTPGLAVELTFPAPSALYAALAPKGIATAAPPVIAYVCASRCVHRTSSSGFVSAATGGTGRRTSCSVSCLEPGQQLPHQYQW